MLPESFAVRMKKLLGAQYDAFLASYDRPRSVGLRLNPLKTNTPPALDEFDLTPVPWAQNGFYYNPQTRPGLSAYHDAGLYYLQEPSAMAPATLLDAQPGERILDLCAAPGGKSTQIAAALRGKGLLVCNEIHPKRARVLAGNIERLGIANALVLNEHPQRLAERFVGWFDRILVDAPCSGEGMFRKEEAAVTDWSEETVEMCAHRQIEILHSAAEMLRGGGRLVYSTCTFSPQENEGAVSAFLHDHPDFYVEEVHAPWFSPGRPDWIDNPALGLEHTFRLMPHLLRGEGHYAAVLRKREDALPSPAPAFEPAAALAREIPEFCRQNAAELPDGIPILFGNTVYLAPRELPQLRGLKVLRAGLELGQLLRGRFEPAHAWALWLQNTSSVADFSNHSDSIRRYLAGETLPGTQTGWTLIRTDGLSLGWAKGSAGQLKNHYPKALRRV